MRFIFSGYIFYSFFVDSIGRHTDGVYEGIAIGGDRYPCSLFIDHVMRYQNNPAVKLIVLLGEV